MPRACGHVASTRLTFGPPVHHPLPRVHQTPQLGPAALHGVRVADAVWYGDRHPFLDGHNSGWIMEKEDEKKDLCDINE